MKLVLHLHLSLARKPRDKRGNEEMCFEICNEMSFSQKRFSFLRCGLQLQVLSEGCSRVKRDGGPQQLPGQARLKEI